MKLSSEKRSHLYVVSHCFRKVRFFWEEHVEGWGNSSAVGSSGSVEGEAEVGTGNVEVLSLGWSESGRSAEVVGTENAAAIVCWPAIGFIFFFGGIFAFSLLCLFLEKNGISLEARCMRRRRLGITICRLPFNVVFITTTGLCFIYFITARPLNVTT